MKKYIRFILLLLPMLAALGTGFAQTAAQVRITMQVTPPYPTRITDLAEQPGKVIMTIQNLGRSTLSIYLRASLTGDNGITGVTDPNYVPPAPLTLQPNQVLQADYQTLRSLFDVNRIRFTGINVNDLVRKQGLPEGVYEVCARAYNWRQPTEALSDASPFGCTSFRLVSLEPPILIKPIEEEELQLFQPQNVVFSWTMPAGAPPGTRYRLRVVEMLDAKRNINDAFLSGTAPTFFEKTVQGNIYVYGPADPPMVQGRKYAWAVTALDEHYERGQITREGTGYKNSGRSEVRGFIVGKKQENARPVAGNNSKPGTYGRVKFTPNTEIRALNLTTFKGKLQWAFRKTETGSFGSAVAIGSMGTLGSSITVNTNFTSAAVSYEAAPGNAPGNKAYTGFQANTSAAANTNLNGSKPATGSGSGGGGGGGGAVGNAAAGFNTPGNSVMNIIGGGAVTNATYLNGLGSLQVPVKDYQAETQNKINQLAGTEHYPLANTDVEVHLYINPEVYKQLKALKGPLGGEPDMKAHIFLGKTKTDAEGNFAVNYSGKVGFGYDVVLEINNPYMMFADIGIRIQSDTNGTYDVGELLGLADTYRLKANVTDEDGNKLDAATVELLRNGFFYNKSAITASLDHEVMRDEMKKNGDNLTIMGPKTGDGQFATSVTKYEIAGKGKSGTTFTRLFLNENYNDRYQVRVSFEKATPKTYNLIANNLSGTGMLEKGVPVIEKTYILKLPNPTVSGRVVSKMGGIPIKGAQVIISPKDITGLNFLQVIAMSRSCKTDSEGKFMVEDMPISDKPYKLEVLFQSKRHTESQLLYLTRRGINEVRDPILINAALTTVCGTVTDAEGAPVTGAALHWKEGGDVFYTDDNGKFLSAQTNGKHILIAQSPGFKDIQKEIDVKEDDKKKPLQLESVNYGTTVNNWSAGVTQNFGYSSSNNNPKPNNNPSPTSNPTTVTMAQTGNVNTNMFAQMAGTGVTGQFENGITAQQATFTTVFGAGSLLSGGSSCNHTLVMTRFFVRATVKDAGTGKPIPNATVQVQTGTKTFTTDKNGVAILSDVPSGSPAIVTKGPADAIYESVSNTITVDNTKDTVSVEVSLKPGSKVTGQVLSKGTAVKGATIYVVSKDYIAATTDDQGKYTLSGVPVGEYTLRAAKEGLLADDSMLNFVATQSYTVNFNLTDPGFNATSLYGFKLNLYNSKPGAGANEFVISGELTDLPDNTIFKKIPGEPLKLAFNELTIVKDGNTIRAKNGEVKTDVSEVYLKAFGYAVVKLSTSDGLRVKPRGSDNTKGEVVGEVGLDLIKTFAALSGWKAPSMPIALTSGTVTNIGALTSDGTLSSTSFKLGGPTSGYTIYNVELTPDWENSSIGTDGLKFKGALKLDKVPLLNNVTLKLNEIAINKNGKVTKVDIAMDPQPVIKLMTWSLKMNKVNLDQYGLKFSGNMDVPIPGSPVAKIGFNNLSIGESGISAGSFFMPEAGIDIFSLVKFKAPSGTQFSLQKMPGSTHYQILGGGTFSLPKLIDKSLVLDNFNVSTNGNFGATAKVDFTVGFASMANLTINKVGFNTASKEIVVGGKFKLNIPNFGLGAQGVVHYKPGSVSVDDLGIEFNLASAIAMSATVKFKNENEFAGEGFLKLAGLIDGVGLAFHYKKLPGGIDVGAFFKTGVIIPIGVVKLDQLGGGFNLNTATNVYTVTAQGRITASPDPVGVVALDPVKLTISSTPQGPILLGEAFVKVMGSWQIGKAELKIDFPNKQFYVDGKFGAGFNIMKGISVSSYSGVHIELNSKNETYWFVAGYTQTSIAHIFNSGVTIAAGWNVPKTVHASLSGIPNFVLTNGRLYGGYFGTYTSLDLTSPEIGVKGIASVKAWYKYSSDVKVYANFKSNLFGVKFDGSWNAGGSADFIDLPVASADISVNGSFEGYYSSGSWGINGSLGASVKAHIGCDGGCNGITWGCCFNACFVGCEVCPCPCGAKICVGGKVNIGYSSANGFDFDLDVF